MNNLLGANFLVVGGAGFVGGNLVRELIKNHAAHITIIDNLLSSELFNVPKSDIVEFQLGSITDHHILAKLQDKFDYVFHLATYHGNQSSIFDPIADHDNNLITTLKLFEKIKNFKKLKKVVYAGAGCAVAEKTYSNAHATPEDAPISLEMDSPYSISKIVGEFYSLYYYKQHQLPTVRARFQNVYGPGEYLGAGKWRGTPATIWRNVTPSFIYRAIKGMPLLIDGAGEATRDFIYIDDIVAGLIACAIQGLPGDVYNLASGVETSIIDIATTILNKTKSHSVLQMMPRRTWDHSGKRFGSTSKSKQILGFEAKQTLAQGIQRTVEWTQDNLTLIDQCINKHEGSQVENK